MPLASSALSCPSKILRTFEQHFFPDERASKELDMKCKMRTAPAWRKLAKAIFHVYVAKGRESSSCAFLQRKTFSLAQLGSAGLLCKVPVFHHVCSTYSQTQTARCNIRMDVDERSLCIVDIAFVRAVYPGTHWFAKAKHVVAKAKVQKSTKMCVLENSRKLI